MRLVQERRSVLEALAVPARPAAWRLAVALAVAAGVVVADQATKSWALHHAQPARHVLWTLWLDLTFNSGAAFGLGRGATPLVEGGVFAVLAALVFFGRRNWPVQGWSAPVGLGLVLGGAIGNLVDRFFRHVPDHPGAVIDFIAAARVGHRDWWPVFNLADAAITVGVAVLVLSLARGRRGDG